MNNKQRKNSVMLSILAILLLIMAIPVLAKETGGQEKNQTISQMIQAIEDSGASAEEIQLRASIEMGTVSTTKELLKMADSWSRQVGVKNQAEILTEDAHVVVESEQIDDNLSLQFRMIGVPQNDGFHAYLVLTITGKRIQAQDIELKRDQVAVLFKKASMIPQFSTCIRGIYSDKLSVDQQGDKLKAVLTALKASEIERLQDETVLSISAHTELWKPFITTGNHKMNVQVATHLDELDSITRITVGTPIITAEY